MDNPSPINPEVQSQTSPSTVTPSPTVTDTNVVPNTDNVSPQPAPQIPNPPKKTFITGLLLIIAVVILGALVFYFLKLRKPNVATSPEPTNSTPSPTTAPTANWTLYTNNKYYYDILIPPLFNQEFIPDQVKNEEQVIRFSKLSQESGDSKVEVYMTSSKTLSEKVGELKKLLENFSANQPLQDGPNSYSKIYISNFIAYQTVFEDESSYTNTLLVEKDKWIYQFILATTNKSEINTLKETVTKINIYDSEAKFYID